MGESLFGINRGHGSLKHDDKDQERLKDEEELQVHVQGEDQVVDNDEVEIGLYSLRFQFPGTGPCELARVLKYRGS